ncbi:DUF4012 domain-containing protein [Microbacterium trichothecenolyticum]|uniref:DUF4012 domain-containing protein n=1 Tax=Microbacterium trichothecenolyticum TaxID=69370 RepID=A0A0M2HA05_MICTR|nr:DUF4012 domain-containing protein [Microbacterium trichothecenolyticum]KJL40815.1 hypothetical protein RS82_03431 [Microbacterium trichothecenolyticum]
MTRPVLPSSARRAGAVIAWVLGGILLLMLAAACWLGVRGLLAYQHLEAARSQVATIRDGLDDPAAVTERLGDLQADTAAAHDLTSDPVWKASESLPWVGPQLAAVSTVAAAVDDLAATSLQPLADAAGGLSLDALRPVDGRFDLETIAALHPAAAEGAAGIARAEASVSSIDSTALVAPLRSAVDDMSRMLGDTAPAADALARATALLPAMLGAESPRDYLVLVQNNAEWRSLGGIVGAMVVLHADDGRLTLTATGSTADFTRFDDAVVPMDAETLALFGERPARYIQNATQIPDFTVSAPIAREMWAREFGTSVDGVLTIDPVTLSYLLTATGPVNLPTGDVLTADNAVDLLLNEVYLRYARPADQDAFFAAASAAVFTALVDGESDPTTLIGALARAGGERRLLIWNAHEDEQALLDGTTLQGRLPVTDATTTRFGVYVNDGTGSKMDYYTELTAGVGWCTGPDSDSLAELTVTLRNNAPADAASLPAYITGAENYGVPRGSARTVAYIYLPQGAELVASGVGDDADFAGFGGGMHAGRLVQMWTSELAPGEQSTATFVVRTPRTPALGTELSPTINAAETGAVASSCESAQ